MQASRLRTANVSIVWKITDDGLKPFLADPRGGRPRPVTWAPQPGSQEAFLSCPDYEVLYEGTRGPGKTDALLMDFGQDVGKGWGPEWRGVLFRKSYPELQDVIDKSKKWFPLIWPNAFFNEAKTFWEWPTGEKLFFRQFAKPGDYWSYHGHAYPWIGWEELTTWASDACYKSMFACSRSTKVGMPRKVRATTNPHGVGHNWVKMRWRLPLLPGYIVGKLITNSVDEEGNVEPPRRAIRGRLQENKILLHADPGYIQRISAAASSPQQRRAWLEGDWDIVAGGMFDDLWEPEHHIIPAFTIPREWRIDRSFDWGSSKPFSIGWWAESDGSDVRTADGWRSTVQGDLFRIHEWYGWNGRPNQGLKLTNSAIASGILERELANKLHGRVNPGPAGSDVFTETNNSSIAKDMRQAVRIAGKLYPGVKWTPADNRPGSRVSGWSLMRERMDAARPVPGAAREAPGLFAFEHCAQYLRLIPTMPRSEKNPDDLDTESEDHLADETRYRITAERRRSSSGKLSGLL